MVERIYLEPMTILTWFLLVERDYLLNDLVAQNIIATSILLMATRVPGLDTDNRISMTWL
jgi:hypothetical protein